MPSDAELAPLLRLVGWERVELGEDSVRLPLAGMELDFGGFGKEYAVDRAALVLAQAGIESALVNLAGDLAILGPQPGGEPWRLGVRHPRKAEHVVATLSVASGAVATAVVSRGNEMITSASSRKTAYATATSSIRAPDAPHAASDR